MDVTVALYGTEARWHVRLPVCPCTSNNGSKNGSKSGSKIEADHPSRKGVGSTTDENYPSKEN